jgi:hypothetical protein
MAFPRLFLSLCLASVSLGSIFTAPEQVTSKKYDFIVVGGALSKSTCTIQFSSMLSQPEPLSVLQHSHV